jgi:cytochrome o ubiquinol oxidase subunit IV
MESSDHTQNKNSGVLRYVVGFISAVILTLAAYILVVNHMLTGVALVAAIMSLAAVQLLVQLVCFLHFGSTKNADSRWHQAAFYMMMLILVIIVGGSLWIMANLNYNMMMTPEQMNEYMLKESSKGF